MVKGGKMARARSHCLPDLTLPIFRIGRKTTYRKRERRGRENERIYKRELPGKGGQLEPRRYNDWLAEANSPSAMLLVAPTNSLLSLCVFVCRSVGIRTQACFGKLCIAAEHSNLSNGKTDISGGSHLADTAIRRGLICRY